MDAGGRGRALHCLARGSLAVLLLLSGVVTAGYLWPPPAKARPDLTISGLRIDSVSGGQWAVMSRLVRHDERWVGALSDFPPGSLTHFRPQGQPGFFVSRLTDGSARAFGDRDLRSGRRLSWAGPAIRWHTPIQNTRGEFVGGALCERIVGDCAVDCYDAEGLALGSPVTGPLAQLGLTIDDERIRIDTVAVAPK